ncbi:hypothetical protein PYCCODRAFT_507860 [Trametes coccinea BRFM310]|uniref:Uncharacterized protein n=1 Tax=Trametes coccinea (strain BRFM310) TaxID=1353009 RepID=A0A1Y2IJT7_TRAC3|nr:hypothetical protein PYCCODRAFT_507860 [Trametes coccinea BRFM310]
MAEMMYSLLKPGLIGIGGPDRFSGSVRQEPWLSLVSLAGSKSSVLASPPSFPWWGLRQHSGNLHPCWRVAGKPCTTRTAVAVPARTFSLVGVMKARTHPPPLLSFLMQAVGPCARTERARAGMGIAGYPPCRLSRAVPVHWLFPDLQPVARTHGASSTRLAPGTVFTPWQWLYCDWSELSFSA